MSSSTEGPNTQHSELQGQITPAWNGNAESLIDCQAIYEGHYPGSRAYRNKNICNMKPPFTWDVNEYAKVEGTDKDGFIIFETVEESKKACAQIPIKYAERFPEMTVAEYVNIFANTSPQNERYNYAAHTAECMSASVDSKLSEVI